MNVAMIGTGGFARRHLAALAAVDVETTLVGHVSRSAERAREAASRWGGRPYTSVQDLLAGERVDAAWITVTPAAHGPAEEALIEAEVPFLVEKPLAADRETPERLAAAIEARALIVAVGYQWRAMDTIPWVRELLTETPPRMVRAAWHGGTPPPAWWRRESQSGGQLVEQATHLFDVVRALVGELDIVAAAEDRRPRAAFPDLDVASASTVLVRAGPEATPGVITATCLLDGAETEAAVELSCDGRLVRITRSGVTVDGGGVRTERRLRTDPVEEQDRAFLTAVADGRRDGPYSTYGDALRTHRACMDAREAARGAGAGTD